MTKKVENKKNTPYPSKSITRQTGKSTSKQSGKSTSSKDFDLIHFFDFALDLLSIIDRNGYFIKVNPLWKKTLGYSPKELNGKHFMDLVHPEDKECTLSTFKSVKKSPVFSFINRYLCKDGTYRYLEWKSNSKGKLIYCIARDISERMKLDTQLPESTKLAYYEQMKSQIEQAIKESDTKFHFIYEHQKALITAIPEIIMEVDENKVYTWANKAGLDFFGEVVLGKEASYYFEGEQNTYKIVQPLFYGDENIFYLESWQRRKDGEKRLLAWWCRVLKDNEGKTIGAISSARDITNQKQFEYLLIESEEKFRTLFENIMEGVALHEIIYDNDGRAINYRIININPAYQEHIGLTSEAVVGKLATDLYETTEPPYLNEYNTVAQTRKPHKFETFFPPMQKYFSISVISPKIGQFATVFEDITDRKKKEVELKQKNEELTRFIYTVSHDLKSPLVTIKAFSGYLKEDIAKQDDKLITKDLGFIQNAADKMGIMLDELLMLSRIGRKDNPKKEIELSSVVQSALDLVAGELTKKKVKVTLNINSLILYCDTQRLINLYQNLIDNAVKFMGFQQSPEIFIGYEKRNEEIILYVTDNGAGIDPRHIKKLFGLFEKLDPQTKGSGLGLALVKRIIEIHNGSIWVESEGLGKGTTIYFTIEKIRFNTDKENTI